MKNLKENEYLQLQGLKGKKARHLLQLMVNRVDGNLVYLKGYRSPFTIEGDKLRRGSDLFLIREDDNNYWV